VVPVADLLRHYQQDPAAADARYRGKTLSVRGEIAGFDRPLARRVYELLFEAPDRSLDLVCQFGYIDEYRTVFTEDSGRVLVGRTEGLATRTLFHRGETVTVRGRCQGLRKGVVRLTQCSRVE
jgi:hypothetical protein